MMRPRSASRQGSASHQGGSSRPRSASGTQGSRHHAASVPILPLGYVDRSDLGQCHCTRGHRRQDGTINHCMKFRLQVQDPKKRFARVCEYHARKYTSVNGKCAIGGCNNRAIGAFTTLCPHHCFVEKGYVHFGQSGSAPAITRPGFIAPQTAPVIVRDSPLPKELFPGTVYGFWHLRAPMGQILPAVPPPELEFPYIPRP